MTGKAYNNRCIQLWLESVMRSAAANYPAVERIAHMSVCMILGIALHALHVDTFFCGAKTAAIQGLLWLDLCILWKFRPDSCTLAKKN